MLETKKLLGSKPCGGDRVGKIRSLADQVIVKIALLRVNGVLKNPQLAEVPMFLRLYKQCEL